MVKTTRNLTLGEICIDTAIVSVIQELESYLIIVSRADAQVSFHFSVHFYLHTGSSDGGKKLEGLWRI